MILILHYENLLDSEDVGERGLGDGRESGQEETEVTDDDEEGTQSNMSETTQSINQSGRQNLGN